MKERRKRTICRLKEGPRSWIPSSPRKDTAPATMRQRWFPRSRLLGRVGSNSCGTPLFGSEIHKSGTVVSRGYLVGTRRLSSSNQF